MDNLIVWEKWRDPFLGYDENEIDVEHQNQKAVIDSVNDNTMDPAPVANSTKDVRVLSTPLGIIPFNEFTASGKIFNFWTGHTNFDISEDVCRIMKRTEGIETLTIFTRYRFRISVGKAFDEAQIKSKFCENVYKYLKQQND